MRLEMGSLALGRTTHKKRNEDCGVHENQAHDSSPAIANTVSYGTGQKDTDKGTTLTSLKEGTLPFGFDSPTVSLDPDTVSLFKRVNHNKISIQEHIKRLHDLLGVSGILGKDASFRDSRYENLRRTPNARKWTHDGEAHYRPPKASPGVLLDRSQHAHLVLAVLAIDSIVHKLLVN